VAILRHCRQISHCSPVTIYLGGIYAQNRIIKKKRRKKEGGGMKIEWTNKIDRK
jgi:hypothetical protein